MGKITSETQGVTTNHFSHQHPLTLINHQPQQTQTIPLSCSGCNHQPSGLIYTCTTACSFFLHKKCFELPKKITHPCHTAHPLTLLPKPVYPNGLFECDACSGQGNGFSYHCQPCGVDLHVNCAIMPLSITHPFHAHQLHLTFQNPYGVMGFCCDICKMNGSNHWLYRCVACGFDAHIKCASSQVQTPLPLRNNQNSSMHNVQSQVRSIPSQPMQQQFVPQNMVNANDVFNQAFTRQMAINNNALAQAFAGPRGANAGFQQLAQLACGGLDVVGLFGGGGGNGLNINGLFGGGNGLDLNGLNGCGSGLDPNGLIGGGGGLDLNGLIGGGGGLDLGGLLGGAGGVDMTGYLG